MGDDQSIPAQKKSRFFADGVSKLPSAARPNDDDLQCDAGTGRSNFDQNLKVKTSYDSGHTPSQTSSEIGSAPSGVEMNLRTRAVDQAAMEQTSQGNTPSQWRVPQIHSPLFSTSTSCAGGSAMKYRRQGIYHEGAFDLYTGRSPVMSQSSTPWSAFPPPPWVSTCRNDEIHPHSATVQPMSVRAQLVTWPPALTPDQSMGRGLIDNQGQRSLTTSSVDASSQHHPSDMPTSTTWSQTPTQRQFADPDVITGRQVKSVKNSFDPFAGFENARTTSKQGSQIIRPAVSHRVPSEQPNQVDRLVTHDNDPGDQHVAWQQLHYATHHQQPTVSPSVQPDHRLSNIQAHVSLLNTSKAFGPGNRSVMFAGLPVHNTLIDLDRDANGTLLPLHLRRFRPQPMFEPIPVCRPAQRLSPTPTNHYTSPKRVERVIEVSSTSLKRKQPNLHLPPPAYVYVRTSDPKFNVFSNGILLYPELCFALANYLPLNDLVNLYSISRDFHTIIDTRFTTTCLSQALRKAPQSAQTYPFRMYSEYCRNDPAARLPHPDPTKAAENIPRKIPNLRWVAFVFHREKVVHEIMTIFAEKGCPLPARCSLALKRIWVLMDIPDNARRIAIIHNHRIFTDLDIYFLMCFFVKLDMVAHDPVAPEKHDHLRSLLLSQKGGLDVVLKVLKRESWQKTSDFVQAWIRTMMTFNDISNDELDEMDIESVFGVPRKEVGLGKYEYWGLKGLTDEMGDERRYLLRPDQLVMREAIRRGLKFSKHFFRCLLYGYVQPDTLKNYEPRSYGRQINDQMAEEYNINDSLGGLRALAVEDGGDGLLDLGNKSRGSRWTIEKECVSERERLMRESQREFADTLYHISEREQQKYV